MAGNPLRLLEGWRLADVPVFAGAVLALGAAVQDRPGEIETFTPGGTGTSPQRGRIAAQRVVVTRAAALLSSV